MTQLSMKNITDFFERVMASYLRPLDLLTPELNDKAMTRIGQVDLLLNKYAQGNEGFSKAWDKLNEEQKVQWIYALHQGEGVVSPEFMNVSNSLLGEGSGLNFKRLNHDVYFDPMVGTPVPVNKNHIPGIAKAILGHKPAGLTEKRMSTSSVMKHMNNEADPKGLITLLARDPKYNPFESAYSSLRRRLNKYTLLGMRPEEGTYAYLDDAMQAIGPLVKRTALNSVTGKPILDPLGNPLLLTEDLIKKMKIPAEAIKTEIVDPKFVFRKSHEVNNPYESSLYDDIDNYIKENFKGNDNPKVDAINRLVNNLKGDNLELNIFDRVMDGLIYQSLVNNPGTIFGNALDALKANISNKALLAAGKLMASDKELSRMFGASSAKTHKRTELGDSLTGSSIKIGDKGFTLPDYTDMAQSRLKSHLWLATILDTLYKKELKNPDEAIQGVVNFLKSTTPQESVTMLKDLNSKGIDILELMGSAMKESNRVAGRIIPENQRGMFQNSAFRMLRMSDSALNDIDEMARNVKGFIHGDAQAKDKLKAVGRATLAKGALFGLPGVVAGDALDTVQNILPEEQQAQMQQMRNTLGKFGVISGPASMVGINTSRLVQPTIQGNPFAVANVPIISELASLTGQGDAKSNQGKLTQGVGAGVRIGASIGRVIAPSNPFVGILNAINPSATGRVAYEGMRTLGIAPDSVAPGQYNFTPTEVRNQTPISYINAILGTTPDWQEKKTMKLMKALNNE
jgi:hypothetical protein